jgi:hypothetical protein
VPQLIINYKLKVGNMFLFEIVTDNVFVECGAYANESYGLQDVVNSRR